MSNRPLTNGHRFVLLRHGQSQWNLENRFTGWTDVPLTEKGRLEARQAAHLLLEAGFSFDIAYTSLLQRAHETLQIVLAEMGLEIDTGSAAVGIERAPLRRLAGT